MKTNGFTFAELIVIIALLALMAIIIGTNMVGLQGKQTEKNYNAIKEKFESAACMYIEKSVNASRKKSCKTSSSGCTINGKELYENGLIDGELIDPSTNEKIDDYYSGAISNDMYKVKLDFSNDGEKHCTFVE